MARLLSVDPAASAAPNRPQTWNRYTYSLNNPLTLIDPDGLEPLEANVRQLLEAFFGRDLSDIDLRSGALAKVITTVADAAGVTIGNRIYLSEQGADAVASRSLRGLTLLAHEITHAIDYSRIGTFNFLNRYFAVEGFNGFMATSSVTEAYHNISFERSAYATAAALERFLQTKQGAAIVDKLQKGGSLNSQDRKAMDAFLIQDLSARRLRLGFQIIEGRLVRARMAR